MLKSTPPCSGNNKVADSCMLRLKSRKKLWKMFACEIAENGSSYFIQRIQRDISTRYLGELVDNKGINTVYMPLSSQDAVISRTRITEIFIEGSFSKYYILWAGFTTSLNSNMNVITHNQCPRATADYPRDSIEIDVSNELSGNWIPIVRTCIACWLVKVKDKSELISLPWSKKLKDILI